MKVRVDHALLTAAIGLFCASISSAAFAEDNMALKEIALRQACTEYDGRFELSWRYNDQGVRWGRIMSCTTKTSIITCQGNVCRSEGEAISSNLAGSFPAEPVAFSNALAALDEQ